MKRYRLFLFILLSSCIACTQFDKEVMPNENEPVTTRASADATVRAARNPLCFHGRIPSCSDLSVGDRRRAACGIRMLWRFRPPEKNGCPESDVRGFRESRNFRSNDAERNEADCG